MHVLFVLKDLTGGGVGRVTLNLIKEFVNAGHVCALAVRNEQGELLNEARTLVKVEAVAPNGLHQFVPRLAGLVKRWQPTHVVTTFADLAVLVRTAMKLSGNGARWVHGAHGPVSQRVVARDGMLGVPRQWLDTRAAAFVCRHADAIVAVSEGVRVEILDAFRVAPERVTAIHNPVVPVNQLHLTPEPRHDLRQPFAITAIGRLAREKGFDLLIEAMRNVPPPWRLEIWGKGVEHDSLARQIARSGLQDSISLCGYAEDPYPVLRRTDLFVLPSRYEGFGNILVEALACQCRIIAADCPYGPREILLDGAFGLLVRPGDAEALSRAICDVALDRMARVNRASLLSRAAEFCTKVAAERWINVLAGC